MNQSNFQNYNYNPIPQPPEDEGFLARVFGPNIAATLKSPLFATGALLLVGAAFTTVILTSYSSTDEEGNIPIVQAESTVYKEIPAQPGGMDVPFQDSTVFESLAGAEIEETAPIENLLEAEDEIDRLEAFAAEAERVIAESEAARLEAEIETAALIEQATGVETPKPTERSESSAVNEAAPPENLIQKVEAPEKPDSLYTPGSSPETLEFVKSVLEEKDAKQEAQNAETLLTAAATPPPAPAAKPASSAQEAAAIAPAAGFAIAPGTHYVQLGSVKTQTGASSEWGKLKKKYSAELQGASYRVDRADLGERGVFFRIQAGPMSGESASAICDSIKAQTPGGCLVVK